MSAAPAPQKKPPNWETEAITKAQRFQKAKRTRDNSLYTVGQVGMLAWVFLLPVLAAGWFVHAALRDPEKRWLAVPILLGAVLVGGLMVRRKVVSLLAEKQDPHDPH